MAVRRRRQTTAYDTYGSVAYAPVYGGATVYAPGRERTAQPQPRPKPKTRTRERTLTRTQVQVRPAGQVAPFAVVGFLMVGVLAAMLLLSFVQYLTVTDQMVSLRRELSALEEENITLSAQYEQVFDMERIQAVVGDTMVRPSADQIQYLDLSQPDSVEVYSAQEGETGLSGLTGALGELFSGFLEYFR